MEESLAAGETFLEPTFLSPEQMNFGGRCTAGLPLLGRVAGHIIHTTVPAFAAVRIRAIIWPAFLLHSITILLQYYCLLRSSLEKRQAGASPRRMPEPVL